MNTETAEQVTSAGHAMVFITDLRADNPRKRGYQLAQGDGLIMVDGVDEPVFQKQSALSKDSSNEIGRIVVDQQTGELTIRQARALLRTISGRTSPRFTAGRIGLQRYVVEYAWGRTPDAAFTRALEGFAPPPASGPRRRIV